jgi:hypothetical protein
MFSRVLALVASAAILAACGGSPATSGLPRLATPTSTSPGSVPVAPMVKTAILPASAMTSRKPANTITAPGYSQLPGSATAVAAASDGSIWVLSDGPAGPDKNIWHYAGGTWTNIGGLAAHIAVAPNGTLYAINSAGGTFAYAGGTWTGLGGGAVGIAVASDNSVYVLSNDGLPDHAIWHYAGGNWTQIGGGGTSIVGSIDTASHASQYGTIQPGGFYLTNSAGAIYWGDGAGGYVPLPGSASGIAPAAGGLFALGYPANASGTSLFYYDVDGANWSAPGGAGTAISYGANALYVLAATGGIYTTAAQTANWPCNNGKFNTDQAAYANGTLKVSYIEENVCGVVTSVLAQKHTSSGNHGYYYVQLPSGYKIEIVCNLDAMTTDPAVWPWVNVGDYSYVQGRYYYDSASSQGMDWTENDTGSWQIVGFVVINGHMYH